MVLRESPWQLQLTDHNHNLHQKKKKKKKIRFLMLQIETIFFSSLSVVEKSGLFQNLGLRQMSAFGDSTPHQN